MCQLGHYKAIDSSPSIIAYASQGKSQNRDMSKIQCLNCKEFGHISRQCKKNSVTIAKRYDTSLQNV